METKSIIVELYTNTLAAGMLLKGDCFDETGKKWIDASKPVTKEEIDLVKEAGFKKIFYKTNKLFIKNPVSNPVLSDQSIGKAYSLLQDIENRLQANKFSIPPKELNYVVDTFIKDIKEHNTAYLNLLDVSTLDEYTYSHSINVSTMSIMMGLALNLENQKIINLGISGLLFDIGKSMVPKDILFKKEGLTPDETKLIRNHPVYGYNLLKNEPEMNQDILDGVLLHHENYLGGGYPLNITHEKISYVPQILAIADTFDAATTNHPYRDSSSFTQVISYIMEESGKKFNPVYSQIFLNHMIKKLFEKPLYYEGAYVLLNTGEIAYVVGHQGDPFTLRPIINIIFNPQAKDKLLKYHQQINLEKDFNRTLVRRIDDMANVEKLVRLECKGDISCIHERQEGIKKENIIQ